MRGGENDSVEVSEASVDTSDGELLAKVGCGVGSCHRSLTKAIISPMLEQESKIAERSTDFFISYTDCGEQILNHCIDAPCCKNGRWEDAFFAGSFVYITHAIIPLFA